MDDFHIISRNRRGGFAGRETAVINYSALRKLYTTDEIALYGEKKLARQWHMTELLQMIAEAEEELNWSRAECLQKYYNKLEQEQK